MTQARTLNPLAAHNAVAVVIDLYSGILADYERQLTLLNAQAQRDKAAHEEQLKTGREANQLLLGEIATVRQNLEKQTDLYAQLTKKCGVEQVESNVLELIDACASQWEEAPRRALLAVMNDVRDTLRQERKF